MKTALIHIGLGKTGTSSVQKALHANRHRLSPVHYPDFGHGASHNHLILLYRPLLQLPRGLRLAFSEVDARENAIREIRTVFHDGLAASDKILLSGEFLSLLSEDQIGEFHRDLLQAGVQRIGVLCYLREPAALYLSRLQQSLHLSANYELPQSVRYRYVAILDTWHAVTQGEMLVRLYDRASLLEGDVVKDFLATSGQFFGETPPNLEASSERNVSLFAESIILLWKLATEIPYPETREGAKARELRAKTVADESWKLAQFLTRPRLRDDHARAISSAHADEIARLESRYGISFPPSRDESTSPVFASSARNDTVSSRSLTPDMILAGYDPNALATLESRVRARLDLGRGAQT